MNQQPIFQPENAEIQAKKYQFAWEEELALERERELEKKHDGKIWILTSFNPNI